MDVRVADHAQFGIAGERQPVHRPRRSGGKSGARAPPETSSLIRRYCSWLVFLVLGLVHQHCLNRRLYCPSTSGRAVIC